MVDFNKRYSYSFPTAIRFGAGVIDELPAYLKDKKLGRPLLVTDGLVAELDFFKKIGEELKKGGMAVEVYRDMHKNPVKSDVLNGADLYHATNRDCIVGLSLIHISEPTRR